MVVKKIFSYLLEGSLFSENESEKRDYQIRFRKAGEIFLKKMIQMRTTGKGDDPKKQKKQKKQKLQKLQETKLTDLNYDIIGELLILLPYGDLLSFILTNTTFWKGFKQREESTWIRKFDSEFEKYPYPNSIVVPKSTMWKKRTKFLFDQVWEMRVDITEEWDTYPWTFSIRENVHRSLILRREKGKMFEVGNESFVLALFKLSGKEKRNIILYYIEKNLSGFDTSLIIKFIKHYYIVHEPTIRDTVKFIKNIIIFTQSNKYSFDRKKFILELIKLDKERNFIKRGQRMYNRLTLKLFTNEYEILRDNKTIVRYFLTQAFFFNKKFIGDKLKNDKYFILEFINEERFWIEDVGVDLRKVPEIVLGFLKKHGNDLKYVHRDLKNKENIVKAALKEEPTSFRYAGKLMKGSNLLKK